MAYAITAGCCADASCVSVCPVDCIHPTPGEPGFGTTEMLYVDPQSCIDCGACADACPVSAVKPVDVLRADEQVFARLNAEHFEGRETQPAATPLHLQEVAPATDRPLRVAVVGTGPAAGYTARTLLTTTDARVTVVDRAARPGGLVRTGVAPDHVDTKRLADLFAWTWRHPRLRMHAGVEVGRDVTHEQLLAHHDAVVYGTGAPAERLLGVPGEDLAGVHGAPQVVGWYNGDPEVDVTAVVPRDGRAIVVGTGNVALDVARVLLGGPDLLAGTDAPAAVRRALGRADVREVVLLGRRGPASAALTRPELLRMPAGIDVVVARDAAVRAELDAAAPGTVTAQLRDLPEADVDWSGEPGRGRRLVLAFDRVVESVHGGDRVEAVRVSSPSGTSPAVTVPASLLVRSTGRRGVAIPGVPFDDVAGLVPNDEGRVVDPRTGEPVPGTYVVGWAKRGARGGIGANRACARETVATLLGDARAGLLPEPVSDVRALERVLRPRADAQGRRRLALLA
jgi:ferredoxin--NADP+ reductase